ncbi:inositol phosphorylceramide synthase [Streptomyces sulfonofaciens]|uniref:Inositol phosphorylceramide synthase n=1 Tax=Streptomyces sulfonofaciens TaxID=68272 RepID=A0A919L303_9ACTN|nr:phosphatase PAP2 family protein [Streptomyces sulfonofaciens]GHH83035.1 inositol phosphorylceramide synthase [Streptomyces sulfonofaciens]
MPQTDAPANGATESSRLRWWTELPLIIAVYATYSAGRLLARSGAAVPTEHGLAILRIERALHLTIEQPLNRIFTRHLWIGLPADFWYASLHYVVTPAIAVWLFRTRPVQYRLARTWLLLSTFVGLIGFTLLPTCPPRLLPAVHGFVDTMAEYSSYGWWAGEASAPRGLGGMTNQYAAMPSLHVGWALWCGLMLWRHGRSPLAKVAAVGYPLVTTVVVVGTANHYLLDAVAGAAVMALGLLLSRPFLRLADAVRERLAARGAPVRAASARAAAGRIGAARDAAVVGDGCQTSAGERIPRQRKQRAEPSTRPADAGDGAAAPAR